MLEINQDRLELTALARVKPLHHNDVWTVGKEARKEVEGRHEVGTQENEIGVALEFLLALPTGLSLLRRSTMKARDYA